MDVSRILAELRSERAQLEEAILSLERLARGRGKRRGRPPSWLSAERSGDAEIDASSPSVDRPKRRGRPPGSKNKPAVAITATSAVA